MASAHAEWDKPAQPSRERRGSTRQGPRGYAQKAVRASAGNARAGLRRCAICFGSLYGCRDGMRSYVGRPLGHARPTRLHGKAWAMADVVVLSSRLTPKSASGKIDLHSLTTALVMVPTFFVRLLKLPEDVRRKYDVSSLELVLQHGCAVPARHQARHDRVVGAGPGWRPARRSVITGIATVCTRRTTGFRDPAPWGALLRRQQLEMLTRTVASDPPGVSGAGTTRSPARHRISASPTRRDDDRRTVENRRASITCGDVRIPSIPTAICSSTIAKPGRPQHIISGRVNIYPASREIERGSSELSWRVHDCAVFGIPMMSSVSASMLPFSAARGRSTERDEESRQEFCSRAPRRVQRCRAKLFSTRCRA